MTMMTTVSLTERAETILAHAKRLDAFTKSEGLPASSFDRHTLVGLSGELEECRRGLVDACQDLKQLGNGPVGQFYEVLFNFTDALSLRFIYHHRLASHVPDDGAISFPDLARASNVDETLLRRFVQHAIINRFFQESSPGLVSHSAASRLLKQSDGMQDTVGFLLDDIAPGSVHVIEAMGKWPGSGEPTETGFNLAEGTEEPFYKHLAQDGERARRFGGGMRFMTQGSLYDVKHLVEGYKWGDVDRPGGCVVDVGGGHGGVSQALARATKHLKFVVQDLKGTVAEGKKLLPPELGGRVEFMTHDFFTQQPVMHADVYFFRFILHNWSDKYAAQILERLIPAMKSGSRVVIYEFLPDEVANTSWTQKQKRNLDMIQATGWNSLERTASDWQKLFASVSNEYQFLGTRTPTGSAVSLIEARFEALSVQQEAAESNRIENTQRVSGQLADNKHDTAVLAS